MNNSMLNLSSVLKTKILVIGAGPAGISFASCFSASHKDFIMVDMGPGIDMRHRDDPFDCVSGVGGAGLFSDGKFSFFPSGTAIWRLPEQETLSKSYEHLKDLFKDVVDVEIPEFPSDVEIQRLTSNTNYELKKYPCFYISLEKRKKLIRHMTDKIPQLLYHHKVIDWEKIQGEKYLVHLENTKTLERINVVCDKIILAGGRFHPLFCNNIPKVFKRYEYGLRLVGANEEFERVRQEEILDPKWMYRPDSKLEFRTFCMCKDGEYVCSNFMGIESFSGRADIPPTGKTNFGLTLRIKTKNDEDFGKVLECKPFEISLDSVLESNGFLLKEIFGEKLGEIYMKGLLKFIENFKLETSRLKVIGPSIEGVGSYPKINGNLQVEGENIFVIGDSSGIFRGIIPSMISGIYLAKYLLDMSM